MHSANIPHRLRRWSFAGASVLVLAACAVGSEPEEAERFSAPTEGEGDDSGPSSYQSPDSIPGASSASSGGSSSSSGSHSMHSDASVPDASDAAAHDASPVVDASLPVDASVLDATPIVDAATPSDASDDSGATYQGVATWLTNGTAFRCRRLERFAFDCPAHGTAYDVWGSSIFSDDSSICTAAVYDGKITLGGGGRIIIEMRPGERIYRSSTRNGITTKAYSVPTGSPDWPCSFVTYPW